MAKTQEITSIQPVDTIVQEKNIASGDVDEALKFLRDGGISSNVEINEKALLRKIDWMMMPLMFSVYFLQYMDKTLISYASIMGLIEDTGMVGNDFSYLATAFYVSFFFCELPHAYMIQRFPTAKYLGIMVICWGICVTMNSVCKNYASVVALRVLLGIFESASAPSLILLTGMWYKRSEQPGRLGVWYQGTSIAPAIASLVAYGLLHYNNDRSFKSWQLLFLIFGLITIVAGILVFFFIPDTPMKSRLTHDEKLYAIERIRENQTGIENKHLKPKQIWEILCDSHTWMISLIIITSNIPNGAVSSFSSIIIENFGYTNAQTLLLNLPGCAIAFVSVYFGCWWGGRYNSRGPAIIALVIPTLLGGALMAWLPAGDKAGLLAGSFLINTVGASLPLLYSWSSGNYAGHTKKVTMNAITLMSFCVGNIIGPLTFRDSDAPQYIPAKITIVAILAVCMVATGLLDLMYMLENKRRDQRAQNLRPEDEIRDIEFMDLTDKENPHFRYCL
ncbi:MFS general substrate transporter [Rhizodiscina lignyota]|uniref:MFS general substrate transporter n=1 Tax=Rhizodiscina lignyota TaxID=1504668 RepID=A0A9P4MCK3_9PEZI|nr:MFS general substrate transporter [Rhizodiscina lignyota]